MDAPSFFIDVRPILEDLGGVVVIDTELALPHLSVGSEEFDPAAPAHVQVTLTNTGAGIVADGTVDAAFTAQCSRCLCLFTLPVTAAVEGFFVEHGREDELPEEQEFAFVAGAKVDLMPFILSALALELPFAPLHDAECRGICAQCGKDLNEGPCTCDRDVSESPFAALKDLHFDTTADD